MNKREFTAKFKDFLKTFDSVSEAYKEANPKYFKIAVLQLVYHCLGCLKKGIENTEERAVTWEKPGGTVRWPIELGRDLWPIFFTVPSQDLRDKKSTVMALVKYLVYAKAINVFRSVTRDVVFFKRRDDYTPGYPPDLLEELQGLPPRERQRREVDLLYPEGYHVDFSIGVADRKGKARQTRGVVEVIFTPLIIDEDRNEAFFPINIGLRFTDCKPKTWSEQSKMGFWKALRKTIKDMTPEEHCDFIPQMFPDVCSKEVVIKQSVKYSHAEKLREFMEPLIAIQARSLEESGKFTTVIGTEGTPSCFVMPDSWHMEQPPDLTKLLSMEKERNSLQRHGEYWTICYEGKSTTLKDSRGLHYLVHLLRNPNKDFRVLELVAAIHGSRVSEHAQALAGMSADELSEYGLSPSDNPDGSGGMLDKHAIAEYESELEALNRKIENALKRNDKVLARKLRKDRDLIELQLRAGRDMAGRIRKAADASEKARKAVSKSYRICLQKIRKEHPSLARHLSNSIKISTSCGYWADQEVHWVL